MFLLVGWPSPANPKASCLLHKEELNNSGVLSHVALSLPEAKGKRGTRSVAKLSFSVGKSFSGSFSFFASAFLVCNYISTWEFLQGALRYIIARSRIIILQEKPFSQGSV